MTTNEYFPKLFEPGQIGKMKIKNRIVMSPMGIAFWGPNGEVIGKTMEHFIARAKGGAGLVRVASVSILYPPGSAFQEGSLDDNWEVIARQYDLVEALHFYGAKVGIQLYHSGPQTKPQPVSCSPVRASWLGEKLYPVPRTLERSEIYQLIDHFAHAAATAKRIGYDMIDLHGAHGYLISCFMSPYFNKRTDEFGGSLEKRMRFPVEIIKRIKEVAGDDFPVGIRISADEFIDGGTTLNEALTMAQILEEAGVAYIGVSSGTYETLHKSNDIMRMSEGWKSHIWEAVTKAVKVPTFAEGGLKTPEFCESVLAEGKADFVSLGRQLLADPEWPNKAAQGKVDEICKCISCMECLGGITGRAAAPRCTVNVAVGRESRFAEIEPARSTKKVMVIGAGPGGMEAARMAALRGHQVTLYDKRQEIGGLLLLAAAPHGKDKLLWIRDYHQTQLTKLGVKMKLGTEVTPDLVEREKPEAVIIATGSEPIIPNIPGINSEKLVIALDILSGKVKLTKQNVVIAGGGMIGAETAEFLAEQNNTVTIVEMLPGIALDMEALNRKGLMDALKEKGIEMLTGREVVEISPKGVTAIDKDSGEQQLIEADWVVLAMGAKPAETLANALEGKVPELYRAGDCREARTIMAAIYEGAASALEI